MYLAIPRRKEPCFLNTNDEKTRNTTPFAWDEAFVLQPGRRLFGDYEIIRLLGWGGAGSVYLVRHVIGGNLLAVKAPHVGSDERKQRLLFREIRTWIDLPEHPNLTACRFFRTLKDRLLIFSEYVDGGSLDKWIQNERLLRLEDILDVAIQFAWGLHAAHINGVVHQDIKPANVLMTRDRGVKITDFGLARANELLEEGSSGTGSAHLPVKSSSVSTGIMTPAYCSPEQSQRQKLDSKTDIWSYGLSVLAMFTGISKWIIGTLAPEILRGYMASGPYAPYPMMPEPLAEVLEKCFRRAPEERWENALQIASAIRDIYRDVTGTPYSRKEPAWKVPERFHEQEQYAELQRHPREWIRNVAEALQVDFAEIETALPQAEGSHIARVLTNIEIMESAQKLLKSAIDTGQAEVSELFVRLLLDKALLHEMTDDRRGAEEIYEYLMRFSRESQASGPPRVSDRLIARIYKNRATNCWFIGRYSESSRYNEAAIALLKKNLPEDDRKELSYLSDTYENQALTLWSMGKSEEALKYYDLSLEFKRNRMAEAPSDALRSHLAKNLMNKANALLHLNRLDEALDNFNEAIHLLERVKETESKQEKAALLGKIYMNKANVLFSLDKPEESVKFHEKAAEIYLSLIHKGFRKQFLRNVALVYLNQSAVFWAMNDLDAAIGTATRATDILERLIFENGRSDLLHILGIVRINRGQFFKKLNRPEESTIDYSESKKIWEHLLRKNFVNDRMNYYLVAVQNLLQLLAPRDLEDAEELFRKGTDFIEQLQMANPSRGFVEERFRLVTSWARELGNLGRNDRARELLESALARLQSGTLKATPEEVAQVIESTRKEFPDILS